VRIPASFCGVFGLRTRSTAARRIFSRIRTSRRCSTSRNSRPRSINCGHAKNGLPIGLQIAGRRFDDLGVLQMARFYESVRPAQARWPEPA